jgi:hypothetical protein
MIVPTTFIVIIRPLRTWVERGATRLSIVANSLKYIMGSCQSIGYPRRNQHRIPIHSKRLIPGLSAIRSGWTALEQIVPACERAGCIGGPLRRIVHDTRARPRYVARAFHNRHPLDRDTITVRVKHLVRHEITQRSARIAGRATILTALTV